MNSKKLTTSLLAVIAFSTTAILGIILTVLYFVVSFFMTDHSLGAQIAEQFKDHPVVKQHTGGIKTAELDFGASVETDANGETLVFNIEGVSKNAKLELVSESSDFSSPEKLDQAHLILPDGTRVSLQNSQ